MCILFSVLSARANLLSSSTSHLVTLLLLFALSTSIFLCVFVDEIVLGLCLLPYFFKTWFLFFSHFCSELWCWWCFNSSCWCKIFNFSRKLHKARKKGLSVVLLPLNTLDFVAMYGVIRTLMCIYIQKQRRFCDVYLESITFVTLSTSRSLLWQQVYKIWSVYRIMVEMG